MKYQNCYYLSSNMTVQSWCLCIERTLSLNIQVFFNITVRISNLQLCPYLNLIILLGVCVIARYGIHITLCYVSTALQTGKSRVRFPIVSLDCFHWHNPSGHTMALGSTQPLTEMSYQEYFGRCVGLTILPPSLPIVLKSGSLNLMEPSGPVKACQGL
jgi:hypothetical protein